MATIVTMLRIQKRSWLAIPLVLVLVVGCSLERPISPEPPAGIFFPRSLPTGPGSAVMTALGHGTLVLHDACVWLRAGPSEQLVIWPSSYLARLIDGRIVIEDPENQRRVAIGDEVEVAGGELGGAPDPDAFAEMLIGAPIPQACRTRSYWLGGLNAASS
jgi:hypothetical protein